MERQLDLLGREIASAMSQSISNAILVDDRFSMTEQLIHARQTNEQIRYIVVDGPEGTMLASTFTEGVPLGFPNGTCLQGQLMKTGSSIVMKGLYGKSSIPLIKASSDISASV